MAVKRPRKRPGGAFGARPARDTLTKQVRRHFTNAHLYTAAFTSVDNVLKSVNDAREAHGQRRVTRGQVERELAAIPAHVLYSEKKRIRQTLPTLSPSLNFYWQMDLVSMQPITERALRQGRSSTVSDVTPKDSDIPDTEQYTFILTAIDIFSRRGQVFL